jgi:hypothetical protein
MRPLSTVVDGISNGATLADNELSISSPGSIREDGPTNTLAVAPRECPLTENQLMQIASKLLLRPPVVSLTKKKIYGRKELRDDYNREYFVDNEPIGEEEVPEISITYRDDLDIRVVEAALRSSPPSAALAHLTRLAIHKRLGSSDADRAVLLHDFAEALRPYPDFVIYVACKSLWETDESPFYPKIKQLATLCELVRDNFSQLLMNFRSDSKALPTSQKQKFNKADYYSNPQENPLRRELCDFLISQGKDDYFEQCTMYSNYQLECKARGLGWGKDIS